jgi:hypothetical protein
MLNLSTKLIVIRKYKQGYFLYAPEQNSIDKGRFIQELIEK